MTRRVLTQTEIDLSRSVFGDALRTTGVTVNSRKWMPFQPRDVCMAPDGHLWFHPESLLYRDDFAVAPIDLQALFIHEMTHVWQRQQGIYLPLARHPFCRYSYTLKPGWPLKRYGIEQQAEIVAHAFLLRQGRVVRGAPPLAQYETVLPFAPA